LQDPGTEINTVFIEMDSLESAIADCIENQSGVPFQPEDTRSLGGGCIHDAACLTGADGRRFFVKRNTVDLLDSFKAEATALRVMADTRTIRVPEPVGAVAAGNKAALVLEYLPIGGASRRDWRALGANLARLHQCSHPQFGWPGDNWIGSSPQINREDPDWIAFYRDCRLAPQVEWARQKGLRLTRAEDLMNALPSLFFDYNPVPSLLHGDLWAGNADFLQDGTPVIYDPATYYGDREADIALTELFGGYPGEFYNGYGEVWPLDRGYQIRRTLYNLYHVLNHYNLFGGGYGSQAESMIRALLRAI
jgi:fructosamine-3-kinase